MSDWQTLDPRRQAAVEHTFAALERRAELLASKAPAGVSASRLWAFALSGGARPDPLLARALLADRGLRDDLAAMLSRVAAGAFPAVAAAATGTAAVERYGKGVHLRLLPSSADPAQTYLVIRLDDASLEPARLVALTAAGEALYLDLVAARTDEIQLLCASDAPILHAIADPETRLWLV